MLCVTGLEGSTVSSVAAGRGMSASVKAAYRSVTCLDELCLLTLQLIWRLLCQPYCCCCYALAPGAAKRQLHGLIWKALQEFSTVTTTESARVCLGSNGDCKGRTRSRRGALLSS